MGKLSQEDPIFTFTRPDLGAVGEQQPFAREKLNTMLRLLLALAIFVTFCDAMCYTIPLEVTRESNPKGCKDNANIMHKFNTKWRTDMCEKCSCHLRSGIRCCSKVRIPSYYDRTKCKEIFNKKSCRYRVVMKANPKKSCRFKYIN
ncbi:beta-microseminoprotein-like [Trichosurus vulpecula]|uniref:beta-microseminoprotein-like n=1 Tax=Trichosurus vulpecula TaxID=9337 RepID=UPI00186AF5C7|nr:beta-microseminoprotein-like [Trichosurus vulpecula]